VKPSVGRAVHYQSYGTPGGEYESVCRAATITEVIDDVTIGVCVMNPEGLFFKQGVHQQEFGFAGGTWHWPERVGE
jgi:hypothetical protein